MWQQLFSIIFKENQAITVYRNTADERGEGNTTKIRFGTTDDQKDNF